MTARRSPRDPVGFFQANQTLEELDQSDSEHEPNEHRGEVHLTIPTPWYMTEKFLDAVHPTLTDFGPASAKSFFCDRFPDFNFHSLADDNDDTNDTNTQTSHRERPGAGFDRTEVGRQSQRTRNIQYGSSGDSLRQDLDTNTRHTNEQSSRPVPDAGVRDAFTSQLDNSIDAPIPCNIPRRVSKRKIENQLPSPGTSMSPRRSRRLRPFDQDLSELSIPDDESSNVSEINRRKQSGSEVTGANPITISQFESIPHNQSLIQSKNRADQSENMKRVKTDSSVPSESSFDNDISNAIGSAKSDDEDLIVAEDEDSLVDKLLNLEQHPVQAQLDDLEISQQGDEADSVSPETQNKTFDPPTTDDTFHQAFDYRAFFEELPPFRQLDPDFNPPSSDPADGGDSPSGKAKEVSTTPPPTRDIPYQRTRFKDWIPEHLTCASQFLIPRPSKEGQGWSGMIPQDIFREIAKYLSFEDLKNLRLVNRDFATQLTDLRFQSVVVPFNSQMFGLSGKELRYVKELDASALINTYAKKIGKFGISFEFDLNGLMHATTKPFTSEQHAWWGTFRWPEGVYPRYSELQELEDLADSPVFLRSAMQGLVNATELGLSIDSGHGWLSGMALSDLEVWNLRCRKSEVFGPGFPEEDVWHRYGREQIFRAGQQTIIDYLLSLPNMTNSKKLFLQELQVRSLESFRNQSTQPDTDTNQHTGGSVPAQYQLTNPENRPAIVLGNHPWLVASHGQRTRGPQRSSTQTVEPPQYPIIINGLNISSDVIGFEKSVFDFLSSAEKYPLKPAFLTEAQAQWLLETYWAQKAFISSYVTSVIQNRSTLRQVHSLHVSKISSGLLDSLGHPEFWTALPELHTITLLVIPDWRRSHSPGDVAFNDNMTIHPVDASIKLTNILRNHISPLENLSTLKIGFIGGGEHAKGLFARNRHILPAPLTTDPKSWLIPHLVPPSSTTIITLEHVQKLTIVNAWVSPSMIENFMDLSRDSSLKHLILDSVSITVPNGNRTGSYLNRLEHKLDPQLPANRWLEEITPAMPDSCVWTKVIDKITPGPTLDQLRVRAGLIDEDRYVPRGFIGNINKITFKSCGYVKIGGIPPHDYNQNWLVMPIHTPMDEALGFRKTMIGLSGTMMKAADAGGREFPLLGRATQCIHPIEKMVLENGYGFKFGWEDDLSRWEAVEDGCFEGGTGRFSGTVSKESTVKENGRRPTFRTRTTTGYQSSQLTSQRSTPNFNNTPRDISLSPPLDDDPGEGPSNPAPTIETSQHFMPRPSFPSPYSSFISQRWEDSDEPLSLFRRDP